MAPLDISTAISLPPLPYDESALEPTISARTLSVHHGKHHKSYVDKTLALLRDSDLNGRSLEEIVRAAAKESSQDQLFNNAAQAWNHTFYWNCLTPGGSVPDAAFRNEVERRFGSLDKLKAKLLEFGVAQFGSGWVWLVVKGRKLDVITTANADTPIAHDIAPLLTLDVWEHAYYLDFQNQRDGHLKAVLDNLINWSFASSNFERAMG